jgi:signal transduction histidine kinase
MRTQTGRQQRRSTQSITVPLKLLAITILVLIIGASFNQLVHERNSIISDTERQMARLDMAFAEQTGRAVESVDLVLRGALDMASAMPLPGPHDAGIERHMSRLLDGMPQLGALAITDGNGVILQASKAFPAVLPPAGLALLADHKADPRAGVRISTPFRDAAATWTALVTRAVVGHDGAVNGLGVAALRLSYFEDFFKAVELDDNGAVILHLRDGTVLARYPHVDAAIGTSFSHLPPFRDVLSHTNAGTLLMQSPIDGSIRVTAIRALPSFPLAVMVSVDQGRLLAGWNRQARMLGAAAVVASLLIAGLLLLLAQRSREAERLLIATRQAREEAEQANHRLQDEMIERERAETALRHAQRIEAIGQLTGGVAHDFNNLLTVVLGNVDLLMRSPRLAEVEPLTRARLQAVKSAAERGATLTNHLLAFARRQPLLPRPTDLNTVIHGMGDLLTSAIGHRATLERRLTAEPWIAVADPTQIELVILNLVMNACDAMPDGGPIVIETQNQTRAAGGEADFPAAGDYVALIVRDSGTGMTADVASRAFEPFFTTKPIGAGSGLGLSQVFGTARQLGGTVEISTAPGQGCAVAVYLPRAGNEASASASGAAVRRGHDPAPVSTGYGHADPARNPFVLRAAYEASPCPGVDNPAPAESMASKKLIPEALAPENLATHEVGPKGW